MDPARVLAPFAAYQAAVANPVFLARYKLYRQAIEAQRDLQIQQVFADLRPQLETQLVPRTWPELLEILALQKRRWTLCRSVRPR